MWPWPEVGILTDDYCSYKPDFIHSLIGNAKETLMPHSRENDVKTTGKSVNFKQQRNKGDEDIFVSNLN